MSLAAILCTKTKIKIMITQFEHKIKIGTAGNHADPVCVLMALFGLVP